MTYLVFWSVNDQRKKRFLREDIVKCQRCGTELVLGNRHVTTDVIFPAIFDESTTPPTLIRHRYKGISSITFDLKWLASKHPLFPRLFIDPSDNTIRDLDLRVVFESPESLIGKPPPP